ncbi:acyl-CoA dehydrogenase family protein [Piscinibacter gummiphilus]|uniref:Acyl-CoA dehydrogenase family protein n=1 Tax=Piscinibacter gummiphilus TaxID=946333 RepID=A0ABZ0CT11_9BURK|nr:acyl-CoA dehydrogenase family protein [Piscinibacter gummiphilus]WOB06057.1 acyl-CoA dehydrogenase family protein [Piscinibacter gummiphilus]
MDFSHSAANLALQGRVRDMMERLVLPSNRDWHRWADAGEYPLDVIEPLKACAKAEGLWNLFLPGLKPDEPGTRLSNTEYAPLAEIMGRVPWASEVFNCSAPDTGNIELLHLYATPAQRERWLRPLLEGTMRSCYAMSEPDVASSDPTNLETSIVRDGDEFVINGRKWFITGALHPLCELVVLMGVSDGSPDAPRHRRHSLVLVPLKTPGLEIVRNIPILQHHSVEGHVELVFRNVRVPASALLGEPGEGFAMAQARLGPGRVHHCMRTIGQCELALELMAERALERQSFGRKLADYANVQDWIAESRVEIDQARLLVMRAAWRMDTEGNAAARTDVAAIKLVAARLQTRVLDRAMQVFGAMGLSPDTPLAFLYTWGRAMRFLDGPDEVHLRTVARTELEAARKRRGAGTAHFVPPAPLEAPLTRG